MICCGHQECLGTAADPGILESREKGNRRSGIILNRARLTAMDREMNYLHYYLKGTDCEICLHAASVRNHEIPWSLLDIAGLPRISHADGESGGKAKAGVELIPFKFFAGWIVKHFSKSLWDKIFNLKCYACEKTFREYLIAGPIYCKCCFPRFQPVIQAVWKRIKQTKPAGLTS